MNPLLVTMRGVPYLPNGKINLAALSDFEAGYIILDRIAKHYPGLTWGQLLTMASTPVNRGQMSGPFDFISDAWDAGADFVGGMTRDTGGMIADVGRTVGHAGMEFLRDDKVQDNIKQAYQGFTESGGVAGFWGGSSIFGGGGSGGEGGGGGGIMDWINGFISGLGGEAKQNQAGMFGGGSALPWLIVGGFIIAGLFGRRAA